MCPPILNIKVSSLQDKDLHHFRERLLLALRCCPDISIVCLMCMLLSIAEQGQMRLSN